MTDNTTRHPRRLLLALRAFVWFVALGILSTCDRPDPSVHPAPLALTAMGNVEVWRLSPEPDFVRTSVSLHGDSVFFSGPMAAVFASNGDIVVANVVDPRLIYLDSLGNGLVEFGRGQGPSEFHSVSSLFMKEDTVVVWDRQNARVSLFYERVLVREFRLPLPLSRTEVVGILDNGMTVVTQIVSAPVAEMFPSDVVAEGVRRPYQLLDTSGQNAGTLLGTSEPPLPILSFYEAGQRSPRIVADLSPYCLPKTLHYTEGAEIVVAAGAEGRLLAIHRSGTIAERYRTSYRDTVRASLLNVIETYVRSTMNTVTESSMNAALQRIGRVGDVLPVVWSDVVPDRAGGAWLQRARCYSEAYGSDTTVTWEVVGVDGRLNAIVSVPRRTSILAVDGDRVLVVHLDELEVPHVALHRLER